MMGYACVKEVLLFTVFNIQDNDGLVVPELLSYTVSIANSATPNDYINETKLSPAHTSTSFCYNIEFGQEYIVKVTAINGVGGNTSSNTGKYFASDICTYMYVDVLSFFCMQAAHLWFLV